MKNCTFQPQISTKTKALIKTRTKDEFLTHMSNFEKQKRDKIEAKIKEIEEHELNMHKSGFRSISRSPRGERGSGERHSPSLYDYETV